MTSSVAIVAFVTPVIACHWHETLSPVRFIRASGRAFALQTLASSADRCPSTDFERTPLLRIAPGAAPAGAPEGIRFRYACDGGKTLDGSAQGRVGPKRFEITLESRYIPASQGIERIKQQMTGTWLGPCKVKPDADALKVTGK